MSPSWGYTEVLKAIWRSGATDRGKRSRIPVSRPCPDPDIWAREEEARRPVVSEIARVRNGAVTDLLATTLGLIPGFLWTLYALSGAIFEPIHVSNFAAWVVEERSTWDASVLLGLPVTVLVPGVLTILLAGGAKSPDGDAWSARELAHLEATRSVLAWGLALGSFLGLLAVVPQKGAPDHATQLLGLAIGVACSIFRQLLRVEGTQKDLLVAMALARREALIEVRRPLGARLRKELPQATPLLRHGPRATLLLVARGMLRLGVPVLVGLLILFAIGGLEAWPKKIGVAVWFALAAASQGLFLLVALSRRRLATNRSERIGAYGFAFVPILLIVLGFVSAIVATATAAESAAVVWVFLSSLIVADAVALRANGTNAASVIDYRRLLALEGYVTSQINWLEGSSLDVEGR